LFELGVFVPRSTFELQLKPILVIIKQTSNTDWCLLQKTGESTSNHNLESLQGVAKNPRACNIDKQPQP
jgi:hypothetical protein